MSPHSYWTKLADEITRELFKRDAAGVEGTIGMPALLGGDLRDPSFEGIKEVIAEVLQSSGPNDALDAARWRFARQIFAVEDVEQAVEFVRGGEPQEEENVKTDAAIDTARASLPFATHDEVTK